MTVAATARNERLRALLLSLDETPDAFAAKLGVNPKTVERWIVLGRNPYPRIAHRAARLLNVEVTYLWPDIHARRQAPVTPADELVACYPGRSAVPFDLWSRLLNEADRCVTIMGDFGLADLVPNLTALLQAKASRGITVRVILTDPATATNPVDHARLSAVQGTYQPLAGTTGVSVTRYAGPLNTTIIRVDDDLLVRTSIDGCPMALAPVMHLRHLTGGPLARLYLTSLDCVSEACLPWTAGTTALRSVAA